MLRFPQDVPPLIENQCRPPDATGADRLAAAVAAHAEFGPPCIIVDAGTAITVDAVGGDPPAFLGGAILPGIRLAADALARSTALVPEIPHLSPGPAIGISTADAVASGVLRGLAGAVDRIIADVTSELSGSAPVITTGGNADLLSALCRTEMQVRPHLVLTGLAVAYFGLGARAPE